MRDIRFRGKHLDNGEWVHGFYVGDFCFEDEARILSIDETGMGVEYEVDPATVEQFIGLHDKKCREIYEGDIVEAWSEGVRATGEVRQRVDGLWIMYPAWQKEDFWGLCPDQNGQTSVEVIGNIHDNPELLKE